MSREAQINRMRIGKVAAQKARKIFDALAVDRTNEEIVAEQLLAIAKQRAGKRNSIGWDVEVRRDCDELEKILVKAHALLLKPPTTGRGVPMKIAAGALAVPGVGRRTSLPGKFAPHLEPLEPIRKDDPSRATAWVLVPEESDPAQKRSKAARDSGLRAWVESHPKSKHSIDKLMKRISRFPRSGRGVPTLIDEVIGKMHGRDPKVVQRVRCGTRRPRPTR